MANVILSIERWQLSKLGYEICGSAGTRADALDCVAHLRPDIVLMHITLKSGLDGIETASQIKKNFNIPVIFVSSHTDGKIISRAKAINPDGFIKKPFDDDDLRVAIELGLKQNRFFWPVFHSVISYEIMRVPWLARGHEPVPPDHTCAERDDDEVPVQELYYLYQRYRI